MGGEVGSEKLRLTWSPQSWLLSESWRLEWHWIDIHWWSDSYASLPWSKTIGLQLRGGRVEDRPAPSLGGRATSDRSASDQTGWREDQRLGAAVSEAHIEAFFETSPQWGELGSGSLEWHPPYCFAELCDSWVGFSPCGALIGRFAIRAYGIHTVGGSGVPHYEG